MAKPLTIHCLSIDGPKDCFAIKKPLATINDLILVGVVLNCVFISVCMSY